MITARGRNRGHYVISRSAITGTDEFDRYQDTATVTSVAAVTDVKQFAGNDGSTTTSFAIVSADTVYTIATTGIVGSVAFISAFNLRGAVDAATATSVAVISGSDLFVHNDAATITSVSSSPTVNTFAAVDAATAVPAAVITAVTSRQSVDAGTVTSVTATVTTPNILGAKDAATITSVATVSAIDRNDHMDASTVTSVAVISAVSSMDAVDAGTVISVAVVSGLVQNLTLLDTGLIVSTAVISSFDAYNYADTSVITTITAIGSAETYTPAPPPPLLGYPSPTLYPSPSLFPIAHTLTDAGTVTSVAVISAAEARGWTDTSTVATPSQSPTNVFPLETNDFVGTGYGDTSYGLGVYNIISPLGFTTTGGNPRTADLVTMRVLGELATFSSFLTTTGTKGVIGETAWPNLTDAGSWNTLAENWYRAADNATLSAYGFGINTLDGAGGTSLAMYTASVAGGALTTPEPNSAVVEAHPSVVATYDRGVVLTSATAGTPTTASTSATFWNGNGGTYGASYVYEPAGTFTFLAGRGHKVAVVSFRWERLQPTLGAALDSTELTRLTTAVTNANAAGMQVVLQCRNYGAYYIFDGVSTGNRHTINDGTLTQANFTDLWTRISTAFQANAAVLAYDLMFQPTSLTNGTSGSPAANWQAISQAAVNAIRTNVDTKLIYVSGYGPSTPSTWTSVNGGTSWISDTSNNFRYLTNHYFDDPHTGAYAASYQTETTLSEAEAVLAPRHNGRVGSIYTISHAEYATYSLPSAINALSAGVWFQIPSAPVSAVATPRTVFGFKNTTGNGGAQLMDWELSYSSPNVTLAAYAGGTSGTLLGSAVVTPGSWYYLEMYYSTAAGSASVGAAITLDGSAPTVFTNASVPLSSAVASVFLGNATTTTFTPVVTVYADDLRIYQGSVGLFGPIDQIYAQTQYNSFPVSATSQ